MIDLKENYNALNIVKKALDMLIEDQWSDGSWGRKMSIYRKKRGKEVTETAVHSISYTSMAIEILLEYKDIINENKRAGIENAIQRAIMWLLDRRLEDGGFWRYTITDAEGNRYYVADVRHTAMAAYILMRINGFNLWTVRAIKYIINNQHISGGWSMTPHASSDMYSTYRALACLYKMYQNRNFGEYMDIKETHKVKETISRAIGFMINSQKGYLWEYNPPWQIYDTAMILEDLLPLAHGDEYIEFRRLSKQVIQKILNLQKGKGGWGLREGDIDISFEATVRVITALNKAIKLNMFTELRKPILKALKKALSYVYNNFEQKKDKLDTSDLIYTLKALRILFSNKESDRKKNTLSHLYTFLNSLESDPVSKLLLRALSIPVSIIVGFLLTKNILISVIFASVIFTIIIIRVWRSKFTKNQSSVKLLNEL